MLGLWHVHDEEIVATTEMLAIVHCEGDGNFMFRKMLAFILTLLASACTASSTVILRSRQM